MSKTIKCSLCGAYLGEIRDAKLAKEMAFLCKKCNSKILHKENSNTDEELDSFIKDSCKKELDDNYILHQLQNIMSGKGR